MHTDTKTPWTPGPWREGGEGVLRIYGPDGRGEHSGLIASFVRRADVKLVVAAPDLYNALSDLVGMLSIISPRDAALDRARAALARARGDAQ